MNRNIFLSWEDRVDACIQGIYMKEYFRSTTPLIDAAVRDFFPRSIDRSWLSENVAPPDYNFDPAVWTDVISAPFYDLFDRGGKRIRPVLTCLTHQALGGNDPQTYRLAIIPELIHSGTLIVDDIEDGSRFRRGEDCVHIRHSMELSINNGNFLYFYPQLIISESDISDSAKVMIYQTIVEDMTKLHIGQGMDIYWGRERKYDIKVDDYMQMSAYKTGALLGIAMKLGAILAGADTDVIARLGKIAVSMGIAFQIQDDILNLRPTEEWGKTYGEDITEGKLTYMVIRTMSAANPPDRERLASILSSRTGSREDIDEAIRIMERYGAFDEAKDLSSSLISRARSDIITLLDDSDYKRIFLELLDFLVKRNK